MEIKQTELGIGNNFGIPYLSATYKVEVFFSFQSNPKNLDPSLKMDLDFFGLFWKRKKNIFERLIWIFGAHTREGKPLFYS